MWISQAVYDVPAGEPVPGALARLVRRFGNEELATTTTGADGLWEFRRNGHPGPFFVEITAPSGAVRHVDSLPAGLVEGVSLPELGVALATLGDGWFPRAHLGRPALTVFGTTVTLSPSLWLALGRVLPVYDAESFPVALPAGGTRVDRLVWRQWISGAQDGRAELAIVGGTLDAGTPALTQDAEVWETGVGVLVCTPAGIDAEMEAGPIPNDRVPVVERVRSAAPEAAGASAAASAVYAATLDLGEGTWDIEAGWRGVAGGEVDLAVAIDGTVGDYTEGMVLDPRGQAATASAEGIVGPASVPVVLWLKRSASYVAEHAEVVEGETSYEETTFEQVRRITLTQSIGPWGIALAPDGESVFMTDLHWDRVRQYSLAGALIRSFGSPGAGNGQLTGPRGLHVRANGNVHVADTTNDRIMVFTPTGAYSAKYGSRGVGNGQFRGPVGVTSDEVYNYVADLGNNRIQKFSGNTYAGKWTTPDSPNAIAYDAIRNRIVVACTNGVLYTYTSTGSLVGASWYTGTTPDSIAVDSGGNYWVADGHDDRLRHYDGGSGELLGVYGETGSDTGQFNEPRGVAVTPDGDAFVTDFQGGTIRVWANVTRTVTVPIGEEITVPATSNPRTLGGILTAVAIPRG